MIYLYEWNKFVSIFGNNQVCVKGIRYAGVLCIRNNKIIELGTVATPVIPALTEDCELQVILDKLHNELKASLS